MSAIQTALEALRDMESLALHSDRPRSLDSYFVAFKKWLTNKSATQTLSQ